MLTGLANSLVKAYDHDALLRRFLLQRNLELPIHDPLKNGKLNLTIRSLRNDVVRDGLPRKTGPDCTEN